ncbi:hypothetical protein Cpir12675_004321 [Ceratocystis pirilliformis]|uniref:Uncharacterized protein n=1 Tax=Ceratocystis pirilliformis TaxID=259994 RepID=A0ABR3YXH4_9PEZI
MLSFYHAVNAAAFVKLSALFVKMSQDASIGLSPDSVYTFLRTFTLTDQTSVEANIESAINLAYEISKEGLDITSKSTIDKAYHMSGIDRENQPVCEKAPAFIEASGGCSSKDNQIFNGNLQQDALLNYNISSIATAKTEHDMAISYNNSLQDGFNPPELAPDYVLMAGQHI